MSKAGRAAREPVHNPYKPNGWYVLVTAVNKGQLLAILVAAFGIVAVFRMPPSDVYELCKKILDHAILAYIGGWILSAALLIFIFFWYGYLRRKQLEELNRLGKVNSELQQKLLDR